MKKLLSFIMLMAIAGGVVWFESRPSTITIPVATVDEPVVIIDETTTTMSPVPTSTVDFSEVNVHLEIVGDGGDDVSLEEVVHEPQHLNDLPVGIRDVVSGCDGVTDRDMVVRIDTRVRLVSSLAADVNVNYGTTGYMTVFEFTDGPICKDDGQVVHHLKPGGQAVMSYWVILRGIVTPDAPDGARDKSWYLSGPVLTLPNLEFMHWQIWGSNVAKCDGLMGEVIRIGMTGVAPAELEGCEPAYEQTQAAGNM